MKTQVLPLDGDKTANGFQLYNEGGACAALCVAAQRTRAIIYSRAASMHPQ